ncbi:cytochrome C assembly family protein [Halotalea alkalilenta]|nr:cytochrome c biogenesis protein CcsA [Halotalea alkalilenta]
MTQPLKVTHDAPKARGRHIWMHAALPYALLAAFLYLFAGLWQAAALARACSPRPGLVRTTGLLAVALHALVLYFVLYRDGELNLGMIETLSLICWVIAVLLLGASLFSPTLAPGAALLPFAAFSLIAMVGLPGTLTYAYFPPGVLVHIASSTLAFALLSIAAVQALLIALQDHALKTRRLRGIVQALPALTRMERMLFELITLGMVLLTISIASGALFVHDLSAQHLTPKTLLSLMAWVIFGVLLWCRRFHGWRGRRAVRWTLVGAVVLVLAYFGSRLLLATR